MNEYVKFADIDVQYLSNLQSCIEANLFTGEVYLREDTFSYDDGREKARIYFTTDKDREIFERHFTNVFAK